MWTDDYEKNLPDAFKKTPDSNNYKILHLNESLLRDFSKDIADVDESNDLFNASGKTLDLFGGIVDQRRGAFNDTQYRYLILAKIARNFVGGDYKSILHYLAVVFNCSQEELKFDDFELVDSDAPCVVKLTKMPFAALIRAGFTSKQAVALIESLFPVCITLEAGNFEGTFEFGEYHSTDKALAESSNIILTTSDGKILTLKGYRMSDMDYDENAGFGNEEQTIGGFFGLMLGEDEEKPLPI